MKFKYSEYQGPGRSKIFRPTVPITFLHKAHFIQTEAMIDSGADFTILPIEMATALKIILELKEKEGNGNQ